MRGEWCLIRITGWRVHHGGPAACATFTGWKTGATVPRDKRLETRNKNWSNRRLAGSTLEQGGSGAIKPVRKSVGAREAGPEAAALRRAGVEAIECHTGEAGGFS
jgi:hypothetical protein